MQLPTLPFIQAGDRRIGPGHPCFVIAEAGVNHNGDLGLARELVDAAVAAGADAVKFQTFRAERLVTRTAPRAEYQARNTGLDETQFEMLKRLELTEGMHEELIAYCGSKGILFLSTPFDEQSADYLVGLNVPLLKIPSGEVTNIGLLDHVRRLGVPVILSTGMSDLGEAETALRALQDEGAGRVALLHCTSNYPADIHDCNLRVMRTMQDAFHVPVGYSDHTEGLEASLAAVALGACIIEKHFTLDRELPGPDHRASLEPDELVQLVRGIRRVEASLGSSVKRCQPSEVDTARVARRSLVAARDLTAGERITAEMLTVRRPGTGLAPALQSFLVGRTVRRAVRMDEQIALEMLD